MTCYQRHMRPLFEELGLAYDAPNRKRVDRAIKRVLGLSHDAHCPEVWSMLKGLPERDREELAARVAESLADLPST